MSKSKIFNMKTSVAWRTKLEVAAKSVEKSSSQLIRDCVNDFIRAKAEQDQKFAQEIAKVERAASKAA